jgi:hypothetical protein
MNLEGERNSLQKENVTNCYRFCVLYGNFLFFLFFFSDLKKYSDVI